MSICDSEENRKKLAWLVPGYILLAWFFCVLFQPLGIHYHQPRSLYLNDKNYEVIYMDDYVDLLKWDNNINDDDEVNFNNLTKRPMLNFDPDANDTLMIPPDNDVCQGLNGTVITLERGSKSAVIVRLKRPGQYYKYRPFNCSIQVKAGDTLDGITAVIEEMDLREHEDDVRQPGGHWGSSICVDYLEAFTDKSKLRNKLCGEWRITGGNNNNNNKEKMRLNSHGPKQTLVGYCYDDRSGHSCESKTIFLNAVIGNDDKFLTSEEELNKKRKGFSVVITGYNHADQDQGQKCLATEFSCPIRDFSLHEQQNHCVWSEFRCDGHQNCGFTVNADESDDICANSGVHDFAHNGGLNPWSISTMTLLIVVYLAIVLILVLVTMILLRWHRALRSPNPLDEMQAIESLHPHHHHPQHQARGHHHHHQHQRVITTTTTDNQDGSLTTEARNGTVSIIVSYRPQYFPKPASTNANNEAPPSYDSLYTDAAGNPIEAPGVDEEQPPNYSLVSLPSADNDDDDDTQNTATANEVTSSSNNNNNNNNNNLNNDNNNANDAPLLPQQPQSCHEEAQNNNPQQTQDEDANDS